uniref:Uncharacterized protein n=1 Tax=Timema cristinae TaxID=61476 RepID=A0A7R9H2V7_TIMCR|nr:unnamed protein product [Timema cristinae]
MNVKNSSTSLSSTADRAQGVCAYHFFYSAGEARLWRREMNLKPLQSNVRQCRDVLWSYSLLLRQVSWGQDAFSYATSVMCVHSLRDWTADMTVNKGSNPSTDVLKTYAFEDDNPLKSDSRALEEGKKKLKAGDLPSAVLCFEAAVQQEPTNALAWELLGMTQAENERVSFALSNDNTTGYAEKHLFTSIGSQLV